MVVVGAATARPLLAQTQLVQLVAVAVVRERALSLKLEDSVALHLFLLTTTCLLSLATPEAPTGLALRIEALVVAAVHMQLAPMEQAVLAETVEQARSTKASCTLVVAVVVHLRPPLQELEEQVVGEMVIQVAWVEMLARSQVVAVEVMELQVDVGAMVRVE